MQINVGSKNSVKINAVKECLKDYDSLSNAFVLAVDVQSNVPEQPMSIGVTINGARNRAKTGFKNCDYSFGIEDGLIEVPNTKTNFMNVCACAIYDGVNFHIGLSSAFEYPPKVTRLAVEEGLDINQAYFKVGLTKNLKLGSGEGAIGLLTKGRLPRKEYIKQAIMMALIHLENSSLY